MKCAYPIIEHIGIFELGLGDTSIGSSEVYG